jgi:hypothetical protein
MGGGDASVVVRGPGERGFRQDYSDITQALPSYSPPIWDVTILRHLRNFAKQVAIGSGRIIAK